MKTNKLMITLFASVAMVASCKDKEIDYEDSPYITVASPTKNQAVQDNDSIRVEALIQPKTSSVVSYQVNLLTKKKHIVHESREPCDCKNIKNISISKAFMYDISKTSDMLLQLQAELEDGTLIREDVPIKLIDSKK